MPFIDHYLSLSLSQSLYFGWDFACYLLDAVVIILLNLARIMTRGEVIWRFVPLYCLKDELEGEWGWGLDSVKWTNSAAARYCCYLLVPRLHSPRQQGLIEADGSIVNC